VNFDSPQGDLRLCVVPQVHYRSVAADPPIAERKWQGGMPPCQTADKVLAFGGGF